MRIRTQFIITMLLFGIILVGMAVSAIITNRQIEKASQQEEIASSIAQGANELSHLSNDYLIYRESQQLKRWQSRFAVFSNQVASLRAERPDQQALVANIRANQSRLKEVFDSVASAPAGPFRNQNLQVSWSRIAVQSQGLVSDASRLSQLLRQRIDHLRNTRTIFMYVMVGLLGAFLLVSYMLTYRRILKSLRVLQAGATVIGSGNLDFMIEEKKNDEIGDLSHAFNQMTTNLKAVTASKEDLEREVTQRKQAEEELRRQREWLGVTLSSIGDAVIASDTEGRVTFLNPVAVTLTGWQLEETLGQPIQDVFRIINERTRAPAEDLVVRVLNEKRVVGLANDTALVTKDGREVPIEDSAAPIKDSAGNVIGVVLVFHDVTEKRRAQAALREAHERSVWLARFPEQNPNPIIRVSADGTVLYCNPASAKFHGWTCEVGQLLQKELLPLVGRAMAEGKEVQEDVLIAGRFYIVWIAPFPEERYANVYGRDVTERKRAEEILRKSEERFQIAESLAKMGHFEWDVVNDVIITSPSLEKIYGLEAGGFKGQYEDWLRMVYPDDRAKVYKIIQLAFAKKRRQERFEFRIVHPDGDIRWISTEATATYDGGGRPVGVMGAMTDITERKRVEEALQQRTVELQQLTETLEQQVQDRTEDLEEANKALRSLSTRLLSAQEEERKRVAGELHDTIGACLSGIKFKVESSLQEMGKTQNHMTESLKTIVPVIQEGIEDCRRMQQDLRPSMLDDLGLLPTLSWFCRRYQTIYTGIKVELEQSLQEEDIPNSLKIVIYRVTQEGMNNIAKHSKADLVRLFLRKMDGRIELVLEDNGQGFDLKKVLGSESTKRGLGLTSMRERIELSGGSFAIESAEGKGTIIRASWPL